MSVLAMRFPMQRRGGWQIAEGRLPAPPAAALALQVAKAETEVVLSGGVDRGNFETQRDNETHRDGAGRPTATFRVQWRAKAGHAPVDQSLSARGAALFDVQEGGLRLVWRFDLEFRGGQRDSFVVDVPDRISGRKSHRRQRPRLESERGRRRAETGSDAAQGGPRQRVVLGGAVAPRGASAAANWRSSRRRCSASKARRSNRAN